MSLFKKKKIRLGKDSGKVFSEQIQEAGIFSETDIYRGLVVEARNVETIRHLFDMFPNYERHVVWKDYMNNHPVYRILSSHDDPEYIMKHPDKKFRFAVMDASGQDMGSIDVEPHIGFLIDGYKMEDRL